MLNSPVTRRWAISAVTLSCVYLLMTILAGLQPTTALYVGTRKTVFTLLEIGQILTGIAFLASGIAVLKRKEWGREGLVFSCIVAIVLILIGVAFQWSFKGDPAALKAMNDALIAQSPQMRTMPEDQRMHLVNMSATIGFATVIFLSLFQILYCALLYRHMTAESDGANQAMAAG